MKKTKNKLPSRNSRRFYIYTAVVIFTVTYLIMSFLSGSMLWQSSTWRIALVIDIIFILLAGPTWTYFVLKDGVRITERGVARGSIERKVLKEYRRTSPFFKKIIVIINMSLLLGIAVLLFTSYKRLPSLLSDLQTGPITYDGSCRARYELKKRGGFYLILEDGVESRLRISKEDFINLTGREDLLGPIFQNGYRIGETGCQYNVKVQYLKGRQIGLDIDVIVPNQ